MDSLKVGGTNWPPVEIANQIALTRRYPDPGQVQWSVAALMKNSALDNVLYREVYREPALVPASPWLDPTPPTAPQLSVDTQGKSTHFQWRSAPGVSVSLWLWQTRSNGVWTTQILPGDHRDYYLNNGTADAASLRAVDRVEILSTPVIWTLKKYASPDLTRGTKGSKPEPDKNTKLQAPRSREVPSTNHVGAH
jgi:hypothetical protein